MTKVLALNDKGEMTYCSSPIDRRGEGRCNHIAHQKENESVEEFTKRMSDRMGSRGGGTIKKINSNSLYKLREIEDELDREWVMECYNSLFNYTKHVSMMSYKIKVASANKRNTGVQEFQRIVMSLDRKRKNLHNISIGSLRSLNEMCEKYDFDAIYPGNPVEDDRSDVANSIFDFFKDRGIVSNFG